MLRVGATPQTTTEQDIPPDPVRRGIYDGAIKRYIHKLWRFNRPGPLRLWTPTWSPRRFSNARAPVMDYGAGLSLGPVPRAALRAVDWPFGLLLARNILPHFAPRWILALRLVKHTDTHSALIVHHNHLEYDCEGSPGMGFFSGEGQELWKIMAEKKAIQLQFYDQGTILFVVVWESDTF